MPHSFTHLTYHLVFATKGRRDLIPRDYETRIHGYLAALLNDRFGLARVVGGTTNHVHILCDIRQTVSVAEVMRVLKSVSCGWIHDTFPTMSGFAWQEGYGAFTVSASMMDRVRRYIESQHEHHRTLSFEEEFQRLLEKHGIHFDPRYLWRPYNESS